MATATAVRTVDEVIAGWRDGDLDGNPAGPVFSEGYALQEITMTGGSLSGAPGASLKSMSFNECTGEWWWCC
jgi:hypothetical protein